MSEPAKLSKAEFVKKASRFLRGAIREGLSQDSDHLGQAETPILKFHGIYQQDDRDARKKLPSGEKRYSFMVRTKIPGGRITAEPVSDGVGTGRSLR